ncbi:MAG: tol-pal system-associated acyl-CoA thioesterase [Alphaproteobacteria bacterium]|nr:tol-pal system-associated acyl-CoA thioesterase [Alphaproteobacteria bacterium]
MPAETSDRQPSGTIRDETHVYPVRVYYEDTDTAGIVYYANYLKFAERARTELLRLLGFEQRDLFDTYGVGFAVRHCEIDFRLPARLDDALEVHSRMLDVGGASLRAEQVVRRDDTDLVRMQVRVACMNREGQPTRIPGPLLDLLRPLDPSRE